jgi:O-antigen ligase
LKNPDDPGSRPDVYEKFLKMAGDAGVGGFGPGTFARYSDRYLEDDPLVRNYGYNLAHEDYLQTVIEWGYAGAFLWALLLVPPIVFMLRGTGENPARSNREFEGYRIGMWDHLSAFFNAIPASREACVAAAGATAAILTAMHAAVDFPMQIASIQFYFLSVIALGWSYRLPAPNATGHDFPA